MPYRRRYRRSYRLTRAIKPVKYSNETYTFASSVTLAPNTTYPAAFIPSTNIQGTRKLKNFTLSFNTTIDTPLLFAIVYVPEGTQPSDLNFGGIAEGDLVPSTLYEPNQNVIMSGTLGGPNYSVGRYKSRLARNLNSGDQIFLVIRSVDNTNSVTGDLTVLLNFAIAF